MIKFPINTPVYFTYQNNLIPGVIFSVSIFPRYFEKYVEYGVEFLIQHILKYPFIPSELPGLETGPPRHAQDYFRSVCLPESRLSFRPTAEYELLLEHIKRKDDEYFYPRRNRFYW